MTCKFNRCTTDVAMLNVEPIIPPREIMCDAPTLMSSSYQILLSMSRKRVI